MLANLDFFCYLVTFFLYHLIFISGFISEYWDFKWFVIVLYFIVHDLRFWFLCIFSNVKQTIKQTNKQANKQTNKQRNKQRKINKQIKINNYSILFNSILFYSILFYSILFYFILFYSTLFYSILFYSILFYSILFYFIDRKSVV